MCGPMESRPTAINFCTCSACESIRMTDALRVSAPTKTTSEEKQRHLNDIEFLNQNVRGK